MRVGYARVSRQDQKLEPQQDALLADGCERVFEEKISSREAERGALREAFDYCREGDVLVVARLDRLGRSLRELLDLVGELEGRGVGFRSLAGLLVEEVARVDEGPSAPGACARDPRGRTRRAGLRHLDELT